MKFFEIYSLTIYIFIYNAWWQKKLRILLYLYVNTFNQITASEMVGYLLPSHYIYMFCLSYPPLYMLIILTDSETHRVLILNSIILGLCIHSRFSGWLIDWCLTPTWVVFQLYCGINALDLAGKVVTFCRHHAIRKLFLPGTSSKIFKKKIPVFSYCFNWNASFSRKCQFLTLIWQRFALNP